MIGSKRIVKQVIGIAVVASIGAMLIPTVAQAAPKRKLTIADAAIVEGDTGPTALSFSVVYSGPPTSGITVDYTTADGTATAGSDYTTASGTATLPGGGCKCVDVTVDVLGDVDEEDAETFSVGLSNPAIAEIQDGAAVGTIYDDDGPPSVVVLDVVVDESAGEAAFDVTLTSTDSETVTVDYATADGTALAASDYTATSGTATFEPGDTVQTVSVPVHDDATAEPDQSFTLDLSDPVEATIDSPQALGTIVDDDADPELSVNDASIAEGDAGSSTGSVTVGLSSASEKAVTVDYVTADAGATADLDYVPVTGTLTFEPGDTEEQVDVPVIGDTDDEGDEGVSIELSGESNATVLDGSGLLTIADDDDTPVVKVPTSLTLKVVKATKKVFARGVLEAAGDGAEVRVVLQVKRNGAFRKLAAKTVAVTNLADRDGDTVADASYRAGFRRPGEGRYRLRVVFAGNDELDRSVKKLRFRL